MEKYLTEGAPTDDEKQSVLDAINFALDKVSTSQMALKNGRKMGKSFFGREMKELDKQVDSLRKNLINISDRVVNAMVKGKE